LDHEKAGHSAGWIQEFIIPLLLDTDSLARMATSSEQLGIRNADRRMADLILEVASSNQLSRKQQRPKQQRLCSRLKK